jgi:crotonobetainyl-CoA:carnitine CoA-transferase CaiB-like acyl-CoA transferase
MTTTARGVLSGLRVLDCATVLAGPLIATQLGDFGADVIKIEHPSGDPLREMGPKKDGASLWWKAVGRNKRSVVIDLRSEFGHRAFSALVPTADVLIENFRPGTLEKWGYAPERLAELNPRLIVVRVSGFGQTGPYRDRPGFGTLVEAMSGYANLTGFPDGPPVLPPLGLADGIAALEGVIGVLLAIESRRLSGRGQIIDLALYEPLFSFLSAYVIYYDQLATLVPRMGNRTATSRLRNAYRAGDGKWLVLSGATPKAAESVLAAIGASKELIAETVAGKSERALDEADALMGRWVSQRPRSEALAFLQSVDAAAIAIYDMSDIFADPQYQARESTVAVPDPQLGHVRMPNVFPRLERDGGGIRATGPPLGNATLDVLCDELGLPRDEVTRHCMPRESAPH